MCRGHGLGDELAVHSSPPPPCCCCAFPFLCLSYSVNMVDRVSGRLASWCVFILTSGDCGWSSRRVLNDPISPPTQTCRTATSTFILIVSHYRFFHYCVPLPQAASSNNTIQIGSFVIGSSYDGARPLVNWILIYARSSLCDCVCAVDCSVEVDSIFIARQRAYARRARYCCGKSVRPSVCLSVCYTLVSYLNESTRPQTLPPPSGRAMTSSLMLPPLQTSKGNSPNRAIKYTGGKNLRLPTEIAVYLGNGTRQAHGYYGSLIGSHGQPIVPCPF